MTPLHHVGNWLRDLFGAIPLGVVRGLFLATLVVLLIWVLRQPRDAARPNEQSKPWFEDLRVWAAAAILIQIAIYAVL